MHLAIDTFPKERFGLITGSKCAVLFPDKGDGKAGQKTYAKTLANEMFFQFYDEISTWQMEHGNMAEHFAFEYFKEHVDASIFKGEFVSEDDCGGSPDYEVEEYGIDFKAPTTLNKWLDYLHVGIDKDQYHQCQMYMHLRKKSTWKVAAFLTETQLMNDNGLTYPVPQNKRLITFTVKQAPDWKDRLYGVKPGIITMRNEFLEKLKLQFS